MIPLRRASTGLTALALSVLAGCGATPLSGRLAGPATVTTPVWALRSLDDEAVPRFPREAVTLRLLPDHGIMGTASCNSVGGGEFRWVASTDTTGSFVRDASQPAIMTVVGCNDRLATQIADRFWTRMTKARDWSIDRRALSIRFDDGTKAVFEAIRPKAYTTAECRSADPNDFDCTDATAAQNTRR